MNPDSVKDIIEQVFQEIKKKNTPRAGIVDIWGEVAGKKVVRHTKPVAFKAGILIINVDSTSWLYELNVCKALLIRKMKKRLLDRPLKELRFRIGAV